MTTFTKLFRAPYAVPNGLQWTEEGLWVADQITDRVALVEFGVPGDYGVTKLIREMPTESSNTSGMAVEGNSIWLAANGGAQLWRPQRPHDARPGNGEILRIDAATGKTAQRYPLPGKDETNGKDDDSGGTHGIECDPFEPDHVWLTTLKSQTLSKVHVPTWTVRCRIALPYHRAHGVVRVPDGIWVVHTADRLILQFDVESGQEIARVAVPADLPEPHGLSVLGNSNANQYAHRQLLYCDATSGWIVQVDLG